MNKKQIMKNENKKPSCRHHFLLKSLRSNMDRNKISSEILFLCRNQLRLWKKFEFLLHFIRNDECVLNDLFAANKQPIVDNVNDKRKFEWKQRN